PWEQAIPVRERTLLGMWRRSIEEAGMRGFDVVTSDDQVVGRVADMRDGYLIVESGHLRKARHPVPHEFVHAVDQAAKAFVTVPRRVLMDSPEVNRKGFFDRRKAARHYGLAESCI